MSILKPARLAFMLCATAALALAAGPAFAHAKLLSEVPAAAEAADAGTAAAPLSELRLTFSEALNAAFSKVEIVDAAGVATNGAVALDPADGKVLVVTLAAPLAAGDFTVNWTAVSDDGHKTTGTYTLNLK